MSLISEYGTVMKLLRQKQQVVFYAESRHYFQYFEKLIHDLTGTGQVQICYITSDPRDPLLSNAPGGMNVFHVKWMLGFLFSRLRADVMVMTMPDLGNYLFKRSEGVACYIYMFHAAVSTHQQYREQAFFNYDAIFCTGEYQEQELRKAENIFLKPPKDLIHYGYPLLDKLQNTVAQTPENSGKPTILIAPSWFEGCLLDTYITDMLEQIDGLHYQIIIRTHPEYEKRKKKQFRQLQQQVQGKKNILMDTFPDVMDRLPVTDILITDRSGIAFEFALGAGRPVVFIETALKQTNHDWDKLGIEPIENWLRPELGIICTPSDLKLLPGKIKDAEAVGGSSFRERMNNLRRTIFYNSHSSYKGGVDYVLSKITRD